MIGIVIVSHSAALAAAALELAGQMLHGDGPKVALAAGTPDGRLGTDAARVADAIDEVASPDGVLVFCDLGSAVLSAELALEFRSSDAPVRLTAAPIVEGLVAALVHAAAGGSLDGVEREALSALSAKSSALSGDGRDGGTGSAPATPGTDVPAAHPGTDASATAVITVRNPTGLHARPAAALVGALGAFDASVALRNRRTGRVVPDAASMSALLVIEGRHGDELELTATGPDAAAAVAEVERLAADGFGEGVAPAPQRTTVPAPLPGTAREPLGVSPGVAVGPVVRMAAPLGEPAPELVPDGQRDPAAARIADAFEAVRAELEIRVGRLGGARFADARAVLEATAALAGDRALVRAAARRVGDSGVAPARAVWDELDEFAGRLADQGGAMAERAADVRDLRARVVARLEGRRDPGLPARTEPFVLAADDLAPADAALLGTTACVGLLMASGGPTSHTAILARSLGLPAVISPVALEVVEGQTVLIDGATGEVVISPSEARVAQASVRTVVAPFDGAGTTADGHRVELLANVASGQEAAAGASARAEGIGLFRTELAFIDRHDEPTLEQQTAAYAPVLGAFRGRKVVVRTLDAGADKPLAFVTAASEPNPALGVRGYRTARGRGEVLATQLRAIVAATAATGADTWTMAPMISTATEARDFAAVARLHGLGTVGVMIETPAAALTAAEVLAEVDFVSVGTNDLAQYTMAADRQLAELAELNDTWQPAVLRLIKVVGDAGAAVGKPVSVCGEAGADPTLAPVLVGLGVTSLSMAPRALDAVAAALRRVTLAQCRAAAAAALAAPDPRAARAAVADVVAAQTP